MFKINYSLPLTNHRKISSCIAKYSKNLSRLHRSHNTALNMIQVSGWKAVPQKTMQRTWMAEPEAFLGLGDRNVFLLAEFHFHLHPVLQKCSAPTKIQKFVPESQTGTTAKSFMQLAHSMLFTQLKLYCKTTSECEEIHIIVLFFAFLGSTSQNSAHYRQESHVWLLFVLALSTYGANKLMIFLPWKELSRASHSQDRASTSLI